MFLRISAILLFILSFVPTVQAETLADRMRMAAPNTQVAPVTFNDGSGKTLDLKEFRGRFVLLNLWATWCGPCVQEMPSLDALEQKLGGTNFQVLAVSEDRDGIAAASAFYKRYELKNLKVYADVSGRMPSLLKVRGLPTTLLIDPNGMEIGRVSGEVDWMAPDVIAFIQSRINAAVKMPAAAK